MQTSTAARAATPTRPLALRLHFGALRSPYVLLFLTLLQDTYADKPWFDFGISNEDHGRVLNEGLVMQKEGFGARSVVHDHYELRVSA